MITKPLIPQQEKTDQVLLAIDAEECRRSLMHFIKGSWHLVEPSASFIGGLPIDAMVEHLEALTRGDIKRLVINIPPRCSKSTICSVIWRAWSWLQYPSSRFMCASYSLDLSTRDNRRCRNLIESDWFQARFGSYFQLASDQQQKRFFENDKKGFQLSTSINGSVTGHGADFLVIDDAHSALEAHSDADRLTALTFFREVWTNRLNSQENGRMLVVGQRIHDEDVCGYIIKERPDWTHLNLPAEYEPSNKCSTSIGWSDPRTQENELLWPERFSKEVLDGLKRDLGSLGYAAQYQQRPVPAGGGQFKKQWFRYFTAELDQEPGYYVLETPQGTKRVLASMCHKFITVDLAISQKQSADYTVISVWVVTPDNELLLLDRLRDRLDNPEQQKQIQLLYQRYHPDFIQIESVAYQLAIIQQLWRLFLPVREYKPVKDKVSRASTAAVFYEAGRIYHPKNVLWLQEWEDEFLTFPLGAHDDQVDTCSAACDAIGGPCMSADEHIRNVQRRVSIAEERKLLPVQGMIPGQENKKAWWQ